MTQRKLDVPENYFSFNHIDSINAISRPIFDNTPIIFFDFTRIYYDGSWIFFTSKNEISQYLFNSGFVFLPHININKKYSFHLFSSIPKFKESLATLKENFDLANILACVDKHDSYIDVYWFGAHERSNSAVNFYLNNLDMITSHTRQFNNKAADLIKIANGHKIAISSTLKPDYDDAFERIKSIHPYCLSIDGANVKFTKRQFDCLRLISNGYTAKMIADELLISARTAESHVERIKNKLSCYSKSELITLLMQKCINQLF